MRASVRSALLVALPITVALGCSSSKNDAAPPAPAQQGHTPPHSPVAATPPKDPGPVTAPTGSAADQLGKARTPLEEMERKAALIRPNASEVKWRDIPWMTSVVEAQKVAAQEKRPILMWISDDDPLDRC